MKPKTLKSLLFLMTAFPLLEAVDPTDPNSPFFFDYHKLRMHGLIVSFILAVLGIIIALCSKFKCGRKASVEAFVPVKIDVSGASVKL